MTKQFNCSVCWLPINSIQYNHYDGSCRECFEYEKATIQNRMNDDLKTVPATDDFFSKLLLEVENNEN